MDGNFTGITLQFILSLWMNLGHNILTSTKAFLGFIFSNSLCMHFLVTGVDNSFGDM